PPNRAKLYAYNTIRKEKSRLRSRELRGATFSIGMARREIVEKSDLSARSAKTERSFLALESADSSGE
ncbi:MAG: hypothetical protein WCL32_15565, partial [Planctomycetota bacterium]